MKLRVLAPIAGAFWAWLASNAPAQNLNSDHATPSMIIAGDCAALYVQIVRYQYSFFNLTGTRLISERVISQCNGPRHADAYADLLEAAYRAQIKVP